MVQNTDSRLTIKFNVPLNSLKEPDIVLHKIVAKHDPKY